MEGNSGVTLTTLHGDVTGLRADIRGLHGELAGLRATVSAVFGGMPTHEQSDEMLRLLRENNRSQEAGLARLHSEIRAVIARLDAIIRKHDSSS